MSGSNNFLQWNPSQANQESDANYATDSQRTGGAPTNTPFPSLTANKLFYQATTMVAAIAQWLANAGNNVSDNSLTNLITTLSQAIALLNSPQFSGTPTAPTAAPGTNTTQIASTAFVEAAITSLLVTSGTNSNGSWIKFPSALGGIIIQMGTRTVNPGGVPQTFTYPIPFTAAALGLVASFGAAISTPAYACGIDPVSATQFEITNSAPSGSPLGVNFIAIGI
jgi:hypothetical protein